MAAVMITVTVTAPVTVTATDRVTIMVTVKNIQLFKSFYIMFDFTGYSKYSYTYPWRVQGCRGMFRCPP